MSLTRSPNCRLFWLQNDKSRRFRGLYDGHIEYQLRLFRKETIVLEIFSANNSFWTELFTSAGHVLSYACTVLWHKFVSARVRHRKKLQLFCSATKHSITNCRLFKSEKNEKHWKRTEIHQLTCTSLRVLQTSALQCSICKCLSGTGCFLTANQFSMVIVEVFIENCDGWSMEWA